MTSKEYVKIADVFYKNSIGVNHQEHALLNEVAQQLADVFLRDNRRFDRNKFLAACGL